MRRWPCTAAQGIVKEEFAGRPDKAFGSRELGYSGLGETRRLEPPGTEARAQGVEEAWCEGEDRFGWSHFTCLPTQCGRQLAS